MLFADDTNAFLTDTDINKLFDRMNREITKITKWFKINKLSLNADKTNYIVFKGKRLASINTERLNLKIDDQEITQVTSTKFLGVIIDQKLSWQEHINYVHSKLSKTIGIIRRASFILDRPTLRSLYFSLSYPYLSYCNIVWGSTHPSKVQKLITCQKKLIRVISKAQYLAHTEPLYHDLGILKLEQINVFQIASFMYKYSNNLLPSVFIGFFNRPDHSYQTRNRDNYLTQRHRLNLSKMTVGYLGPTIWNAIPEYIKTSSSVDSFNLNIKKHLLSVH